MSFGVTSLTAKRSYIDTQSVNEVARQIFTNAESKAVPSSQSFDITQADLSKFRRPEVGLDLYNAKNSIETTKQVAIRNAGLDINLNANFVANVQYLNTQAAQGTTKISKNVEGKLAAPITEGESAQSREVVALPKSVELNNSKSLDKDKRGSNPFSFLAMNAKSEGKETKEEQSINIFA